MPPKTKIILKSIFVLVIFALSVKAIAVWQAPTAAPADNNAQPPINVGTILQYKGGSLVVDGFKAFLAAVFDGTAVFNSTVSIGTFASPPEKLNIAGNIYSTMGEGLRIFGDSNYFGSFLDGIVFEMQDGNSTGGNTDGGFVFRGYTPTDSVAKNWMVIKSPGNIGIGTTSPAQKLDVNGSIRINSGSSGNSRFITEGVSAPTSASAGGSYGLEFYAPSYDASSQWGSRIWKDHHGGGISLNISTQQLGTWYHNAVFGWGGQAADPLFGVYGGAAFGAGYTGTYLPPANGLIVQGNVGIGTTGPGYKLDVAGDVNVTGNFKINGVNISNSASQWTTSGSDIYYGNAGHVLVTSNSSYTNYTQPFSVAGDNAAPATSGSAQNGMARFFVAGPVSESLDIGIDSNNDYTWIQSRSRDNYATNYTLALNPNGGNVGVATTSPLSRLFVAGGSYNTVSGANNAAYALGAQSIAANDSIYSYGAICAGNSSGNCTGTGGTVILGSKVGTAGSIGAGTINPSFKLQVVGNGTSNHNPMFYSAGAFPQYPTTLQEISQSITANSNMVVGLNLANSSTTDSTYSPFLTFSRKSDSGNYNPTFAAIAGQHTGDKDSNWTAGDLTFWTAPTNAEGPKERMRINSAGNVGIGAIVNPFSGGYPALSISTGSNNTGLYSAGNIYGIQATSPINAIWGYTTTTGSGVGVYGSATNSSSAIGVMGEATGNLSYGVYGTGGTGVYGEGTLRGVYGESNGIGVNGSSNGGYAIYCNALSGGQCAGTVPWTSTSDIRMKQNVSTLTNALDKVIKLRGVDFEFKNNPGTVQMGFIAQEALDILPEVISKDPKGYYSIQYGPVTALLVEAMKEQQKQIEDLKKEIELLKK